MCRDAVRGTLRCTGCLGITAMAERVRSVSSEAVSDWRFAISSITDGVRERGHVTERPVCDVVQQAPHDLPDALFGSSSVKTIEAGADLADLVRDVVDELLDQLCVAWRRVPSGSRMPRSPGP